MCSKRYSVGSTSSRNPGRPVTSAANRRAASMLASCPTLKTFAPPLSIRDRRYDVGCPRSAGAKWPGSGGTGTLGKALKTKIPFREARKVLKIFPLSDGQDFFFLVRQMRVNLGDVLVGQLLDFLFALLLVFFAGLAGLHRFLQFAENRRTRTGRAVPARRHRAGARAR